MSELGQKCENYWSQLAHFFVSGFADELELL